MNGKIVLAAALLLTTGIAFGQSTASRAAGKTPHVTRLANVHPEAKDTALKTSSPVTRKTPVTTAQPATKPPAIHRKTHKTHKPVIHTKN